MKTEEQITPNERARGLREIAKDSAFLEWPEAKEELLEAAKLLEAHEKFLSVHMRDNKAGLL